VSYFGSLDVTVVTPLLCFSKTWFVLREFNGVSHAGLRSA
jgi:hypothetical protein